MVNTAIDVAAGGALGALLATGIALVWSVRRMLPLQLAGIAAIAGAATLFALERYPGQALVGIALALAVGLPVALGLEWLIDRPMRQRSPADALLASAAGLTLLTGVAMNVMPEQDGGSAAPVVASALSLDVLTLVLATMLLALVVLVTKFLKLGLAMRAVGYDSDTAALMGINEGRVLVYATALAATLIAIAAALMTLRTPPSQPLMLLHPVTLALAGAAMAGPRHLRWSAAAGMVLGCLDSAVISYADRVPALRPALPLACLTFLLLLRVPQRPIADAAQHV